MPETKAGLLNRDINVEKYSWLDKDLPKGSMVYKYYGYTYGFISESGVAVTDEPGKTPFFEIPKDSIDWI